MPDRNLTLLATPVFIYASRLGASLYQQKYINTQKIKNMKTFKMNTLKMTIKTLLCLVLLTTACAQSEKSKDVSKATTTSKSLEKPKTDIHTAIISGDIEMVKQHLDVGTDINAKEPMSGATPLMTAVTFNQPKIAQLLIDAKPDLSIKNNDGSTALHIAAFFGRIDMVQMLLDAKADKNLRNNFGATPRETVLANFEEMKPIYDMLILQLKPMGFSLDLEELQKARPVVAMMLQ